MTSMNRVSPYHCPMTECNIRKHLVLLLSPLDFEVPGGTVSVNINPINLGMQFPQVVLPNFWRHLGIEEEGGLCDQFSSTCPRVQEPK